MKSLLPIILIVAAVGLFFVEVKPFYSEVSVLRAESAEYDHALEMAKELDTLRGELERKLESFSQPELERLNHFLPQQLDTVRIILDVDGIGVRNGIDLDNIKVSTQPATSRTDKQPKAGAGAYQAVDVTFDFEAPYGQALNFIKDMEKSLRLLDSVSVEVTPVQNKSTYNFKMSVRTYWINR